MLLYAVSQIAPGTRKRWLRHDLESSLDAGLFKFAPERLVILTLRHLFP
jgi:hypothetical protein